MHPHFKGREAEADGHVLCQATLLQGLQRLLLPLHLKTLLPVSLLFRPWTSSHKLPPAFRSRV